jgi:hypothetical protein
MKVIENPNQNREETSANMFDITISDCELLLQI